MGPVPTTTTTVLRVVQSTGTDRALLVAVLALFFTVTSFWWIHLRRGRLRVTAPATFAGGMDVQQLRVRFPLVIFNTGAAAITIENLRLLIDGHEEEWISFRRTLRPTQGDFVDFAAPFAVGGREARQVFVEFGESPPSWRPEPARSYPARIDRLVGKRWKPLIAFTWWAPKDGLGHYIAHRNTPGGGPPADA